MRQFRALKPRWRQPRPFDRGEPGAALWTWFDHAIDSLARSRAIGVYETVRSLLPSMLAPGKPGHILYTASLAGLYTPPGWHHAFYSATKFAVAALTQGMRDEIGAAPIKVSAVYPGLVQTIPTRQRTLNTAGTYPPGRRAES